MNRMQARIEEPPVDTREEIRLRYEAMKAAKEAKIRNGKVDRAAQIHSTEEVPGVPLLNAARTRKLREAEAARAASSHRNHNPHKPRGKPTRAGADGLRPSHQAVLAKAHELAPEGCRGLSINDLRVAMGHTNPSLVQRARVALRLAGLWLPGWDQVQYGRPRKVQPDKVELEPELEAQIEPEPESVVEVEPENEVSREVIRAQQIGGDHYRSLAVQPWDALEAWLTPEQLYGYHVGTALVYLSRAHRKGGLEDLRKARHTLDELIRTQAERD